MIEVGIGIFVFLLFLGLAVCIFEEDWHKKRIIKKWKLPEGVYKIQKKDREYRAYYLSSDDKWCPFKERDRYGNSYYACFKSYKDAYNYIVYTDYLDSIHAVIAENRMPNRFRSVTEDIYL